MNCMLSLAFLVSVLTTTVVQCGQLFGTQNGGTPSLQWRLPKYAHLDEGKDWQLGGSGGGDGDVAAGTSAAGLPPWLENITLSPQQKNWIEKEVDYAELLLRCGQNPVQEAFSGWSDFGAGLAPALGHYGLCKELDKTAQWCSTNPMFVCANADGKVLAESNKVFNFETCYFTFPLEPPYTMGLCANSKAQCPTSDLNRLLYNISSGSNAENSSTHKVASSAWSWGGRCLINTTVLELMGCSPEHSFTYLEAKCDGDELTWEEDSGAVVVFVVIMILCGLVGFSTVAVSLNDWVKEYRKAQRQAEVSKVERMEGEISDDATTEEAERERLVKPSAVNITGESSPDRNETEGEGQNGAAATATGKEGQETDATAIIKEPLPALLLTPMRWFDIRSSLGNLFTVQNRNLGDTETRFFEGLRFIAMFFVVYGHSLVFPIELGTGASNFFTLYHDMSDQYVPGITLHPSFLAVDAFFFLSGFLFLHLYMKRILKDHAKKCKALGLEASEVRVQPLGVVSTIKMYLHRYLRLTPMVMAVLVTATWLIPHLPTASPLTSVYRNSSLFTSCKENWWHQILYIANLQTRAGSKSDPSEAWGSCMGWFWYLDCDMQLFLVAPMIAAVYVLWKPAFYFLSTAAIIGAAVPGGINNSYAGGDGGMDYTRPWYRAAAYVWGFVAAALVRSPEVRQLVRKWPIRALCYLVGTALLTSSINLLWVIATAKWQGNDYKSRAQFSQGWALFAWGGGLTLFTIPWACGHGGLLPRLLGLPAFAVLSKLTFATYLIHPVVMMTVTASSSNIPTFNYITFYYTVGGFIFWATLSAVGLWVLVEYPFAKMNDMLTRA